MAPLESSLFSCTSSPLSIDSSSFRKLSGFHVHCFKLRSSKIRTSSLIANSVSELKNPEAKPSRISQSNDRYDKPRYEANSEINHMFSLLKDEALVDFRQIHSLALKSNAFRVNNLIGNKLVLKYSKNIKLLGSARKMFDEIPKRTRPCYAALITGYCRLKKWEDMFSVLGLMIDEGLFPDKYVLPTVFKACSALKMLRSGKMIHGHVVRINLDSDVFFGNSLIDFYANCRDLRSSRNVFDSMGEKDVVSWTSLIAAYMDAGFLDEGAEVFHSMHVNGLKPDLISWNTLVSGFAQNGDIDLALQSFEEMQEKGMKPRVNSWNGIISGCVQSKYFEDALDVFYSMLQFPEDPNFVTMASILSACAGLKNLYLGKAFHGFSVKHRLLGNVYVEGSLIDMYSKCGRNDYAGKIFLRAENKSTAMWNEMIAAFVNEGKMAKALELLGSMQNNGTKSNLISYNTILVGYARDRRKDKAYELLSEMIQMNLKPNIVSFNILVSGFQQSGLPHEALKFFQAMLCPSSSNFSNMFSEAVRPNSITTTSALAACAHLNSKRQGKEIHGYLLRHGFERNTYVSSALVHMYSKCHDTNSATNVFWSIEDKNTICWNALIAGHVNNVQPESALELFRIMISEGIEPSEITIMIVLLACGDIAGLRSGREIHGYVLKRQFEKRNENLANALIGMYAKCGSIIEAKSVFNYEIKDVDLWNATISACSVYGISRTATTLFEQLELAGIWTRHCS